MRAVIAGGGRTAAYLAGLLLAQQHTVRVIEPRREVLERLHGELPTEAIIEGNPLDRALLEQSRIAESDVLVACMPDDADNLMLCYLARTKFNVGRTIAWINNPKHAWLFNDDKRLFNVDVALNQAEIVAKLLEEEMSMGDMMVLLKLQRGRFSLIEEKLPPDALAVGMAIKNLPLPGQSIITAILRNGEVVLPRGETILQAGDEVLAVAGQEDQKELAKLFESPARAARHAKADEAGG
jgi:trk system potassium uptake protein TrkA